jgi:periplasmic protein TonB
MIRTGQKPGLARVVAFCVSAALHGAAAAALIGITGADPPEPLPMVAVEIVAQAPPGAGGPAATKGARTPRAGTRRAASAPPKIPSKAKAPPKALTKAAAKPPPPARRPPSQAAIRPTRPAKPLISKRALRAAARSARLKRRHKDRSKPQAARYRKAKPAVPGKSAATSIAANTASAYRPPRPGGGSAGNPLPKYPKSARRRGAEGRVVLAVRVGADGRARSVALRQSSGDADLDAAALEAVRRWRFAPASRGGVSVEGLAIVPIRFRLVAR